MFKELKSMKKYKVVGIDHTQSSLTRDVFKNFLGHLIQRISHAFPPNSILVLDRLFIGCEGIIFGSDTSGFSFSTPFDP